MHPKMVGKWPSFSILMTSHCSISVTAENLNIWQTSMFAVPQITKADWSTRWLKSICLVQPCEDVLECTIEQTSKHCLEELAHWLANWQTWCSDKERLEVPTSRIFTNYIIKHGYTNFHWGVYSLERNQYHHPQTDGIWNHKLYVNQQYPPQMTLINNLHNWLI
jgi:hypothetical protein